MIIFMNLIVLNTEFYFRKNYWIGDCMLLNEIKLLIQIFTVGRFVFKKILYVQLELFHVKITCIILNKLDKSFQCYFIFIGLKNILNSQVDCLNKILESDISSNGCINWPPVSPINRPVKILNQFLRVAKQLLTVQIEYIRDVDGLIVN